SRLIMACRRFTVCVEGNIGCGKSSFIRHFANKLPGYLNVLEEPVAQWTSLNNNNLLGMMYSDPKRWCTAFQAYVMLTMSDGHSSSRGASAPPVTLLERSLHSACRVFVENLHMQSLMDSMDYHILMEWYNLWVSDQTYDIDVIIYLRAKPSVCLERVKKRNRSEECDLSLELLEQLHQLHEDWLINHKFGCPSTRVVVLDAEQDFDSLMAVYDREVLPILRDFAGEPAVNGSAESGETDKENKPNSLVARLGVSP
ncbi:hypothetical protein BOX15_Mlig000511g10, partial [Macrostomum lignano]